MDRLVPHSPPPCPSLNPQSIPFLLKLIFSIIFLFPWTDLFLTHRIMTSRVTGITTKVREFTDLRYKTFFLLRSSIDWVRDLAPSTIERKASSVVLGISWTRRLRISSTRGL
ncbi:unnamed protein product [Brassica oleracea var. botrytis]|uniref:Uncharacterized protein n=2 Tax=Brassica TaxID=3705 RepID=A0A3P6EZD1_BRAOL|nr:unnamed protein product [Brassica napus]CDY26517.1 BnaC01g23820D [Brassica napus]VDD50517.1 unnamed protein product [Brassica oleracea]